MNPILKYSVFTLLFSSSFFANAQDEKPTLEQTILLENDTNKALAWVSLSKTTMHENYQTAQNYGDSALKLSVSLNYPKGTALAQKQIADGLYYQGNYEEALVYYVKVYDYYFEIGNEIGAAKMLSNIGLISRFLGQYEKAMEYFFRSLEILESYSNVNGIASAYNNIAIVYAIQQDFEPAKQYFLMSLKGFRQAGNTSREHSLMLDIGGMYFESGNPDSAIYYISAATKYYEANGPKVQLGRAYYLLGNIHKSEGNYSESNFYYQKSIEIYNELGDTFRVAGSILRLSELAQDMGKPKEAIDYALGALETIKDIDSKSVESRIYLQLYNVYKSTNNFEKALYYKELNEEVQQEINEKSKVETIAELEEKYQSEQKERQLAELKADNSEKEIKAQNQEIQKWGLAILVVFVVIIALGFFNQVKVKKKNNELLRAKNKIIQKSLEDKEVLFREVHHRVKNNLQFISSLLNLQARHIKDEQAKRLLLDSRNRIASMSLVHQKLYEEDNIVGVDMSAYVANLLDSLVHSYKVDQKKVEIIAEVENLVLDIDSAIPIGIILNELITNSFKYAFADVNQGQLKVVLKEEKNRIILEVRDNGKGLPDGFNLEKSSSFGMQLLQSMIEKLKGEFKFKDESGFAMCIALSQYKKEK